MVVPGNGAEMVRFITMDREIMDGDIKLRAELINRILFGLDINKPATTGEGESRFQMWTAGDDERRVAVLPDLEALSWALTRLILHRRLKTEAQRGTAFPDEMILRTGVWFELDRAAIRANRQEDARQATDRILISDEAGRRDMGYNETDAIEGDERVRRVGVITKQPYLALWGTPEHKEITDAGGWEIVSGKAPGPLGTPGEEPQAGPGVGDPGSPESAEEARA